MAATTRRAARLAVLVTCALALAGRPARGAGPGDRNEPWIGYAHPSGGRGGQALRVKVGGQNLRAIRAVHVTGTGVSATVVDWVPPFRPLDGAEARELRRILAEVRAQRAGRPLPARFTGESGEPDATPVPLPEHPYLRDLETQSLEALAEVERYFFTPRIRAQEKRAIAETVRLDLRIDPSAAPGPRELRLLGPAGATNPVRFDVGTDPEVLEREPNDATGAATGEPLEAPFVVNGQLLPRDVDRFAFRARAGQHLVVETFARRLVPYQADSVPGWMQAVVAIFDARGGEVAWADDWRGGPDPVLLFPVPEDGVYVLEVRDAIHRGREDFVYRIAVAERPFVTSVFPLGAREGEGREVEVEGWNLPVARLPLDARPGLDRWRFAFLEAGTGGAGPVPYVVDPLAQVAEVEPNDAPERAQALALPRIVDGRIDAPGDVDVFRFHGIVGQVVAVEVLARRLGSPLDAVLRLTDPAGKVVAWSDDEPDPSFGLLTHQADAVLLAKLTREGPHYVRLWDALGQGGPEHGYRLRVGPPRPDFTVIVTPSTVNVPVGRAAVLTAHVVRHDGFDGPVEVALAQAPAGFVLEGGLVPAGRSRVRMTLSAPSVPTPSPVALRFEARGAIAGRPSVRGTTPADDVMQAFSYRHLVPAQVGLALVTRQGTQAPLPRWARRGVVRLSYGGRTTVRVEGLPRGSLQRLHFDLDEPPEGVTIQAAREEDGGVVLVLEAARRQAEAGTGDNLIVEVYSGPAEPLRDGTRVKPPPERYLGVLPALPMKIVPN